MTKDEALIVALETLKQIQEGCNNVIADKLHSDAVDLAKLVRKDCNKPIDAIRKSLAQPEQEPDVGLTDEEIEAIGKEVLLAQFHTSVKAIDEMKDPTAQIMNLVIRQQGFNFAKAIEAKLREKNA